MSAGLSKEQGGLVILAVGTYESVFNVFFSHWINCSR